MASDSTVPRDRRVTAVLGPTNTGKTHYAVERMLAHRTGVIGLPLRLLAREVYDRIVALRGPSVVALVTGEERIVPARAAYWVCTVEAMPVDIGADFLAVDEIQLCGDPDRGHIFTDRLLHARGLHETLFLGAETMRARIASLVPGQQMLKRERFSQLTYTGARKISRMPPRSAIVGFSVQDVYAIAELFRRQKGGAAVVMGALSPRTRNAQVALYQNGDVDYLVATDAIGMGLNLDISHVALSGLVKFDGRRHRHLAPNELAQIAGRAGRFTTDGTFGVTGEASPLEPEVVEAIENHRFAPLSRLQWRSSALDFASPRHLIASLEVGSHHPDLARAREADDLATLKELAAMPDLGVSLGNAAEVKRLWDVCQVPDFRKVTLQEHAALCLRIWGFLRKGGIPTDWLARQIARIDRTDGDIDTLSKRLAYIRTWTYVAQRPAWIDDAAHWREETRAVEDRLSDALHVQLTQRFVDRRTSVLMRRLKQKESLVATVTENGEVTIDDQFIGRLEGFRFRLDPSADADQARTLRQAGLAALAPALSLRADKFYNAPDTEIDVTEQGGLMWGEHAVGKLVAGADALSPQIQPFVDEDADPSVGEKVKRRLGHWVDRKIAALFQPLVALRDDEALSGMARGIAFRLVEALGILPRGEVADDVKGLDQESRAGLRRHGVRFGQYTVFLPLLLKPAPTRLRLVLWSLAQNLDVFPESPPPGLVTVAALKDAPGGYYPRAGYRLAGDRAIRIDMLERLADMTRNLDARGGFEATPEMLSITGLSLEQFAKLMRGLGYHAEESTRPKRRQEKAGAPEAVRPVAASPEAALPEAAQPDAPQPDAPQPDAPQPDAPQPDVPPMPVEVPDPDVPVEDPAVPGGPDVPIDEPTEVPPAPSEPDVPIEEPVEVPPADLPPAMPEAPGVVADGQIAATAPGPAGAETRSDGETETFFLFTRGQRRRPEGRPRGERSGGERSGGERSGGERAGGERQGGERSRRGGDEARAKGGKPRSDERKGDQRKADGKGDRKGGNRTQEERKGKRDEKPVAARAPRHEKPIDPDNPFAALMALKLRP
ncbi:ATP-dependent RNA helicase SUPV3L1/SUV3 [Amaricoccus macauensis]|uniref:ATP-dependent RNA helicase SUPV3L1/SUV3 n=1 Tax=Amaricoccus macauensis TaxID=57001 RepID=A0A840SN08_9RHOB|nr:helicase-related protein [Amaricoccus macauensis]MBB5221668.1 ATP-dependent RNA helicase SUPV3L1/SUV3 [Amaricoccus macauensis]